MINLQKKLSEVKVVSDQFGSLTTTNSLARICWEIVISDKKPPNIMHWSENGQTNWYEIALEINRLAKELNILEKPTKIIPILSSEYSTKAKRPKYSLLDIKNTEDFFKIKSNNWKSSLKKVLLEIKSK